jgi:hypothetical protein
MTEDERKRTAALVELSVTLYSDGSDFDWDSVKIEGVKP